MVLLQILLCKIIIHIGRSAPQVVPATAKFSGAPENLAVAGTTFVAILQRFSQPFFAFKEISY